MVSIIKKLKFWGYNPEDGMNNRRNLAFFSAIYALMLWPNVLLILHLFTEIEVDVIKAMLAYVGTIASTAIGGYLWASIKEVPNKDDENA